MNYHNKNTCFNEITPEFSTDNLFAETASFEQISSCFPNIENVIMSDNYESNDDRMSYH